MIKLTRLINFVIILILTWDVENIILIFSNKVEFMFLGNFSDPWWWVLFINNFVRDISWSISYESVEICPYDFVASILYSTKIMLLCHWVFVRIFTHLFRFTRE
jgi:hypothetical protein